MKLEITGIEELEKNFKRLEEMTTQRKALSAIERGFKNAAKPMLNKAKQYAPYKTGGLEGSIKITNTIPGSTRKAKGEIRFYVRSTAPHAHIIEYGTGPRYHADGKYVGSSPPDPFLRPAFEEEWKTALEGLESEIAAAIKKAIVKAGG